MDEPHHGPVQIFEIGPGPQKGAPAGPLPVPESNVSPERLREEFGMPEGNQEKFAAIAAKHGVEIDVRPTNVDAPDLLEQGAGAQDRGPEGQDDLQRGPLHRRPAGGSRQGRLLMPEPPARPRG